MIKTQANEDIIAFYKHGNDVYKIIDKVEDFKIVKSDGTGGRWYRTHSGMTLLADIQMALTSYFGEKVLQKDIDLTL